MSQAWISVQFSVCDSSCRGGSEFIVSYMVVEVKHVYSKHIQLPSFLNTVIILRQLL